MDKDKLLSIGQRVESVFWIIILSVVVFINISPHVIVAGRLPWMAALSFFLLILVFNRFMAKRPYSRKKLFLKAFVYVLFATLFLYAFGFEKYNMWIFYFFPVLLSLSLSVSLITHPRASILTLVAISIFLLGDIYWQAHISPEAVQLTFPLVFSKVFSLSLLSIFGYYLYRREMLAIRQANLFSEQTRKLNEQLNSKNQELLAANQRLQELAEVKSRFVATVSHELRTPLTAIRNSLKLIEYEVINNKTVDEYSAIIKKNIDRQAMMIDNLLDLARIERGYMQGARSCVDLNKTVAEAVELLKDNARNKNIRLLFHPKEGLPFIWADQDQMRRIFINLIDNGIKFSPLGGCVEVTLEDGSRHIQVIVADNGPGIPKEDREKIFEAFVQLCEGSGERVRKGIGLGLTIVKEIVDLHKGLVWVESELGRGTKFFITLPKDLRSEENG